MRTRPPRPGRLYRGRTARQPLSYRLAVAAVVLGMLLLVIVLGAVVAVLT